MDRYVHFLLDSFRGDYPNEADKHRSEVLVVFETISPSDNVFLNKIMIARQAYLPIAMAHNYVVHRRLDPTAKFQDRKLREIERVLAPRRSSVASVQVTQILLYVGFANH